MEVCIYKLVDPRDSRVRYIGQTNDPDRRLQQHIAFARSGQSNRHRDEWIRDLLRLDLEPRIEIIEVVSEANAAQREEYWIAYYRRRVPGLTNMTGIRHVDFVGKADESEPYETQRDAPIYRISSPNRQQFLSEVRSTLPSCLSSRVLHPGTVGIAARYNVSMPTEHCWAVGRYTIDFTVSTSVGVIHQDHRNDYICIDTSTGRRIESDDAESYFRACMTRRKELKLVNEGTVLRSLTNLDIRAHLITAILDKHTETVHYWGANSQLYTKECAPSSRHITLRSFSLFLVDVAPITVRFASRQYRAHYAVPVDGTNEAILLETDLPDSIPICQRCGDFDDRDTACKQCDTFLCSNCAPQSASAFCSVACRKQNDLAQLRRNQGAPAIMALVGVALLMVFAGHSSNANATLAYIGLVLFCSGALAFTVLQLRVFWLKVST